jgi:hypothetical protein
MVVPNGKTLPGACDPTSVGVPQLSVAVGGVQLAEALQELPAATTISAETHPLITGFVTSCTVTLKEHVVILPNPSVAVYVTAVVPIAKILPGACVEVRGELPQLSVAVGGVQLAVARQNSFAGTTIFAGQPAMTGAVLSFTTILNEHVEIFPWVSVAV